jgi:hypothetical protein
MNNHEYKIYVEIASQIFAKCFERGSIEEKRGWPAKLSHALDVQFRNNYLDAKSLSDLHGRIRRLKSENIAFQEMGISERTLLILSRFALIDDYKLLNNNYKGIEAAYSSRPFSIFNFLRIPTEGLLTITETGWAYQTKSNERIKNRSVVAVSPFCMPGDNATNWIKVDYHDYGNSLKTGYFAAISSDPNRLIFLSSAILISFFNALISE